LGHAVCTTQATAYLIEACGIGQVNAL